MGAVPCKLLIMFRIRKIGDLSGYNGSRAFVTVDLVEQYLFKGGRV